MKRTISMMMGKGSVNHNTRKFQAENTDPERAHLNKSYCNENIKAVYRELFDDAVKRYNEKQTRTDRCIKDYYNKIQSSKQEKLFHEIILQVGNKDDMSATSENGKLAQQVLDEYYQSFQSRNPNLRVFSAHLHMDEATPHIHIDFVPFTTGSKRGLDTRVSLKQALSAQGFKGGSRSDTEWNQWVQSEKQQLAAVMERHGIEREQLGTNREHLSVLDYKKERRSREIAKLETKLEDLSEVLEHKERHLKNLDMGSEKFRKTVQEFDESPKWQLPEPQPLQTAKSYKSKAESIIQKWKSLVKKVLSNYLWALERIEALKFQLSRAYEKIEPMNTQILDLTKENYRLKQVERRFNRVQKIIGKEEVDRRLKVNQKIKQQTKNYYER